MYIFLFSNLNTDSQQLWNSFSSVLGILNVRLFLLRIINDNCDNRDYEIGE